jgi:hypothetical protein
MSGENRGLFEKYLVRRVDGRDEPGEKHADCRLFVLDLSHDRHARVAAAAYATSCEADLPLLAADLRRLCCSPGERAWRAYCEKVGGTAYDGKPLPAWDELGERQRQGWQAAAAAAGGL